MPLGSAPQSINTNVSHYFCTVIIPYATILALVPDSSSDKSAIFLSLENDLQRKNIRWIMDIMIDQ